MLRCHEVDGVSATAAAVAHGYSRAAFYLVEAAFDQHRMAGLLDERRGRKGPVKLTPPDPGVAGRHRPRALGGGAGRRHRGAVRGAPAPAHDRTGTPVTGLWSPREAAQASYEQLRQATLDGVAMLGVSARRFARRGLPGLIAWPMGAIGGQRWEEGGRGRQSCVDLVVRGRVGRVNRVGFIAVLSHDPDRFPASAAGTWRWLPPPATQSHSPVGDGREQHGPNRGFTSTVLCGSRGAPLEARQSKGSLSAAMSMSASWR